MLVSVALNTAICSYSAWERPWLFHQQVSGYPGLTSEDRAAFEAAWKTVNHKDHWMYPDLNQSSERIQTALEANFNSFDSQAIRALINGASYQWK